MFKTTELYIYENARSLEALGEARPGQSSLSAGALRYRARGTPGRFPMGSGVLCVDRGGEMVLSSPASALPHL